MPCVATSLRNRNLDGAIGEVSKISTMLFMFTLETKVTFLLIQCFGYIIHEYLLTPSYFPIHCALLIRHSNIDRLFAIWQALHNDTISNPTFVAPSDKSRGTRVIAKGPKQNAKTPLAPFNASEKVEDLWTSAAA